MTGRILSVYALAIALFAGSGVASAGPIRVLVLPVVVHTATDESEYLSEGLAQMLSARFEQAGGVEVLRVGETSQATTDAATAVATAGAENADFVVFGSFTQFGDGASLDVRCARVVGADSEGNPEARQVFVQSGKLGDIIPRLGDLSSRILHYMKDGAVAVAPAGEAPAAAEEAAPSDLERRVEALERAVFFTEATEAVESTGTKEAAAEGE